MSRALPSAARLRHAGHEGGRAVIEYGRWEPPTIAEQGEVGPCSLDPVLTMSLLDFTALRQTNEPRWTTSEVALFWKKKTTYVSTAARDGRIPGALKLGDEWRFVPAIIRALEGALPAPSTPRPRATREPAVLKNPVRPGRRGHPKPAQPPAALASPAPRKASEWAAYWEAQECRSRRR